MISETWSPQEWKDIVENVSLDPVAIAVAAAFEGSFGPVDCRDLADLWGSLHDVVGEDLDLRNKKERLIEIGDVLMELEIIETYDYVPEYSMTRCIWQAQEFAGLIVARLYGAPDEGKYAAES